MKVKVHIAIGQYEFVEQELEYDNYHEVKQACDVIKRIWEEKEGLPMKEWQGWLINQLLGKGNGVEEMEQMNEYQRRASHDVKKALATITRRNEN